MTAATLGMLLLLLLAAEPAGAPAAGLPADPDFRIGPGDVLEIEVVRDPASSGRLVVDGRGGVEHPLLGRVEVEGRTCDEVRARLQEGLAEGFIHSPRVIVRIAEYRSFRVTLLGEVREPGLYHLRGKTGVLDLALAAGISGTVPSAAEVMRVLADGSVQRTAVNLAAVVKGDARDVTLERGDLVVLGGSVTAASGVTIVGEVKTPGVFQLSPGETLLGVVLRAGGPTEFARRNGTRIYRGGQAPIEVRLADVLDDGDRKKDVPVAPGDLVVVPSGPF